MGNSITLHGTTYYICTRTRTDYATYCWTSSRADKGMGYHGASICRLAEGGLGYAPVAAMKSRGANRVELHEWFGVWRNDGT